MDKNSNDEMEQIQKGLENFLEREVDGYQSPGQNQMSGPDTEIRTDMLTSNREPAARKSAAWKSAAREPAVQMHTARKPSEQKSTAQKPTSQKPTSQKPADEDSPAEHGKKKKKKKKSLLRRIVAFLLILCVLAGGLWYFLVGSFYNRMNYEEIETLTAQPMKEDGVINILLIGNDSRTQGEDGRSDAMILLSVSSKTKTIQMMSLLRDMYVDIPGYEGNRLNAAYAFGGPELLIETIEQNLDIDVNRYVLVNFQAFAGLVDAAGGVDLELTNEEVQYVNGYLTEYNVLEGRPEGTDYLDSTLSGMIHLNGPQALAYCRNRYLGTDFGRTERQRKVLTEVISKIPKTLVTNAGGLLEGLFPNLTTNLTKTECMQLSLQIFHLASYDLVQSSIPIQGSYTNASIRGMSVLEVDFEKNKEFIRQSLYGE